MSMVFNMVGGGSGGLSPNNAVIHVTAPAGSTITFSKGGVAVKMLGPEKSHVNADDNTLADWYYAVSSSNYGEWTITASLSASTTSKTVTVSENKQYNVRLSYVLYLFKSYVGLDSDYEISTDGGGTFAVRTDNEYIDSQPATYSTLYFDPAIDIGRYSSLVMDVKMLSTYSSYAPGIGVVSAPNGTYVANKYGYASTSRQTLVCDVGSVNSESYVAVRSMFMELYIYNIYLIPPELEGTV